MSTIDFIRDQLAEDVEGWKADHEQAMECYDLEALIQRGLGYFYMVRVADEAWSRKAEAGEVDFNHDHVRAIREGYEWWLGPCDRLLGRIKEMEDHYEVKGAEEFRKAYRMAKNLTKVAVDDLLAA